MSSIDPSRLIHVTAAPERRPGRLLRSLSPRPGTETKVLVYRLEKALERGDKDAAAAIWKSLSPEERAEIRDGDEIRKGNAMPPEESRAVPAGPTKPGWTAAFWLPRNWNFNLPHADPNAPPSYRAPKTTVPQETTGPRRQIERGAVIHWTAPDGNLYHGKAKSWGTKGLVAITHDGDEHGVVWGDVRVGVHPVAMEEHEDQVRKSQARDRDREFRDTVEMLSLSPEDRAAWWRRRHGEDL